VQDEKWLEALFRLKLAGFTLPGESGRNSITPSSVSTPDPNVIEGERKDYSVPDDLLFKDPASYSSLSVEEREAKTQQMMAQFKKMTGEVTSKVSQAIRRG